MWSGRRNAPGVSVLFKTTAVSAELRAAHPDIRALANDLDAQLQKWGLGQLVVTDVLRTPDFYPDGRWSWHLCGCAFDFRTKGFSGQDVARILAWLQGRAFGMSLKVDVVSEPSAARGPHIHVEVEDHERRREYEQRTGRRPGVA